MLHSFENASEALPFCCMFSHLGPNNSQTTSAMHCYTKLLVIWHRWHTSILLCNPIFFCPDSTTIFNLSPSPPLKHSHIPPTCLHASLSLSLSLNNNYATALYTTPYTLWYVTVIYLHLISKILESTPSHHIHFFHCSPPPICCMPLITISVGVQNNDNWECWSTCSWVRSPASLKRDSK